MVKRAKKQGFASILARRAKVAHERPRSLEGQVVSLARKGMLAPAAREAIASQLARGLAVTFSAGTRSSSSTPTATLRYWAS